jgi:hypothetical protein
MIIPRLAALALALTALAGCGTQTTTAPASDRSRAPASPSSTTAPSLPGELTAEQDLGNNPPPPQNVRTRVLKGDVEVTWDDPPVVTVPHSYSDRVVSYRVYRQGPGESDLRPIGVTSTHKYVDATAVRGLTYDYAATSVRKHQVEGPRSQPESVTLP